MDFSNLGALETIKWVLGQSPGTPPTQLFIQLHIGAPGATGVNNIASEATRHEVNFGIAANVQADGRAEAVTDAGVTWLAVTSSETYSHISIWDAVSAGGCWYQGPMSAPVPVSAGSDFTFPAGSKLDHA